MRRTIKLRGSSRNQWHLGPMGFLAGQIVKRMGAAGWPSRVHCLYRSPEEQQRVYDAGYSRARPWRSPHQYYAAADIIHAVDGWNVPAEYWDALADIVNAVQRDYGIDLDHGHFWRFRDSAHVEIADWREFRADLERDYGVPPVGHPSPLDLYRWFQGVSPDFRYWLRGDSAAAATVRRILSNDSSAPEAQQ